jgi:hypothetical protein
MTRPRSIARKAFPGINHLSDRDAFIALLALVAAVVAIIAAIASALLAILRAPAGLWRRAREAIDGSRSPSRRSNDGPQLAVEPAQEVQASCPTRLADPPRLIARFERAVEGARLPTLADARTTLEMILAIVLLPLFLPYWLILAAKGALVFAARMLRRRASARTAAQQKPSRLVFVSYRTTPHAAVAREVSRVLEERGFEACLDQARGLMPSRTTGVDARLDQMIRRADVVVAIRGEHEVAAPRVGLADAVDQLLALAIRVVPWLFVLAYAAFMAAFLVLVGVIFWPLIGLAFLDHEVRKALMRSRPLLRNVLRYTAPAPALALWYRLVYHVDILPRPGEPWQLWEQRMAHLYGVPIVQAMVAPQDSMADRDVPIAGATTVLLRPERLKEDVSTRLVPAIASQGGVAGGPLAAAKSRFWAELDKEADALAGHHFRTLWWCMTCGWLRTLREAARALPIELHGADVRSAMARHPDRCLGSSEPGPSHWGVSGEPMGRFGRSCQRH